MSKRLSKIEDVNLYFEMKFEPRDWELIGNEHVLRISSRIHCLEHSDNKLPFDVDVYEIDEDSINEVGVSTETEILTGDVVVRTTGEPFYGAIQISK